MMEDSKQEQIIILLTSIKKWISFFGYLTIIGLIFWTGIFIYNLNKETQEKIQTEYNNRE
jgi:hypothetical protein